MGPVSLYAELALHRHVSMSAIGSVIVIASLEPFSLRSKRPRETQGRPGWFEWDASGRLPTALGDAGQLARVGHLPDADATQAEHAVDGSCPPATRAAGVAAHLELRLAPGLGWPSRACLARGP